MGWKKAKYAVYSHAQLVFFLLFHSFSFITAFTVVGVLSTLVSLCPTDPDVYFA